eukprot:2472987-Rhodomonas_salina.1
MAVIDAAALCGDLAHVSSAAFFPIYLHQQRVACGTTNLPTSTSGTRHVSGMGFADCVFCFCSNVAWAA